MVIISAVNPNPTSPRDSFPFNKASAHALSLRTSLSRGGHLRKTILSAIIQPDQAFAAESLGFPFMRRSRSLPFIALIASCITASVLTQTEVRADLTPVDVSFPNQTVLSNSQPFGSSIIVADFDGDGRPDVAAASLFDSEISWYRNLGDGAFSPAIVISTAAAGPNCIVAADIDADGRPDIVSASTLDDKIAWYRNTGSAPATLFGYNPANPVANQRVISRNVDYAYSVTVADVNGDGLWDVVSAGFFDSKVAYYLNLGGGNFGWTSANPTANQHVISTAAGAPSSVASGDLDGDGIFDLAVTSVNENSLAWFKGGYDESGAPTFTRHVLSTDLPRAYNVAIADMNKDRAPDLIVASPYGNKVSYFRNMTRDAGAAAPFFAPEQVVSSEARGATTVIAADINRDGNLDIVAALLLDNRVIWFAGSGVDENGNMTFGPDQLVSRGGGCRRLRRRRSDGREFHVSGGPDGFRVPKRG
jgi:FG-GAP-like repeat